MTRPIRRGDCLPDRLADEILRRVFIGAYPAGSQLPPERALAVELGTDRTSLRVALAQLKRMNLISSVQGSGMVVLDYRAHAGVEFFLHAFRLPDTPDEAALLAQAVEYFGLTMPGIWARVALRASADAFDRIEALFRRQYDVADDLDAAIEAALEARDEVVRASRNPIFQMTFRAIRPLRARALARFFPLVDVRGWARANLEWVQRIRSGEIAPHEVAERYSALVRPIDGEARRAFDQFDRSDRAARFVPGADAQPWRRASIGAPRRENAADRLANRLMRSIFDGAFAAGQRLPSERALTVELGVDRTTLRQALGQLKRMNLIQAVQGSGMTVLDVNEHATLDFFAEVFRHDDTPLEDVLLRQVLEYLDATVPALVGVAARRASPEGLARLRAVLEAEFEVADQPRAAAELIVRSEDLFAAAAENVVIDLVYRSTRPLRLRLQEQIVRAGGVRERAQAHLQLLDLVERGQVDAAEIEARFRAYQAELYSEARRALPTSSAA